MSTILSHVIKDLKRRESKGIKTYGTTMDRTDLDRKEWMNHLYEELLDAALYIKKLYEYPDGNTKPVKRRATLKANRNNRKTGKETKAG